MPAKLTVEELAQKAKCTPLAAELVAAGLSYAADVKQLAGAASRQVTAEELCRAMAETAQAYYGPSVKATYTKAGIQRSEDIGRIIFTLIEQGLLKKRDEEQLSDFDGLFETAKLT